MISVSLLICSLFGAEQPIDDFRFTNAAAARAVWDAKGGPPVDVTRDGNRSVLKLSAPFDSQRQMDRASMDRKIQMDLSASGIFLLDAAVGDPQQVGELRLYFRSGQGWFVARASFDKRGWQTLRIPKSAFSREGTPTGWNTIDGIRISVWRAPGDELVDASIRFRRLSAVSLEIALVQPVKAQADSAYWRAMAAVQTMLTRLKELGVDADSIDENAIDEKNIEHFRLIVLPYAPALNQQGIKNFARFVQGGGKLLFCAPVPEALDQTWRGFEQRVERIDWTQNAPDAPLRQLAAALGRQMPSLWGPMARKQLDEAPQVGHCTSGKELAAYLRGRLSDAEQTIEQARHMLQEARAKMAEKHFAESFVMARDAHRTLAQAYLRAADSPSREGRAAWSHSGLGVYPGDWPRSMKLLAQNGFNMVLINVLWGGLAQYPSDVLPRSGEVGRFGDQVQQCLDAAKPFGVEVHVWKVNFNLGNAPQELLDRLRREGRTQVSDQGKPLDWLCPSHPDNRELERAAMLEVVGKYPIDGLHFDYIRYPSKEYCYCDGCRRRFEAQSGRPVVDWPTECRTGARKEEYNEWRVQQITSLVRVVSGEAKKIRPGLKISAAVYPSYPSCRDAVAQDWVEWIKSGWLDFVCPMNYSANDETFASQVRSQLKLIGGRAPLYPGIGASATGISLTPDRVVGQVHLARALGAAGFAIFNFEPDTAESVIPAFGLGAGATKAVPPHRDFHSDRR